MPMKISAAWDVLKMSKRKLIDKESRLINLIPGGFKVVSTQDPCEEIARNVLQIQQYRDQRIWHSFQFN